MISHTHEIRVRYAETDQMGYVYYGIYATYFEVGRVELVRSMGVSYAELEEQHQIMMPVLNLQVEYLKPARYDQLLKLTTHLLEIPTLRLRFRYELHSPADELLVRGATELVFVHKETLRPVRPPAHFLEALRQQWQA